MYMTVAAIIADNIMHVSWSTMFPKTVDQVLAAETKLFHEGPTPDKR